MAFRPSFREALEAGETILLNSIGLTNPGIQSALSYLAPQWAEYGTTVLLSLSADSVDQFGEMTAMTRAVSGFQGLELNLSCPISKMAPCRPHCGVDGGGGGGG